MRPVGAAAVFPLPGTALGNEDIAEIRITVDRTFVPANRVVGSHDTRELGIQVYHAGPFPASAAGEHRRPVSRSKTDQKEIAAPGGRGR